MKKLTSTLAIALSLAGACTLAYADGEKCDSATHTQHTAMSGNIFNDADSNHDGIVSKGEFSAYYNKHTTKHFNELDLNHDGKLTANEMQGGQPPSMASGTTHMDQRFNSADANHDGGLDQGEAVNMPMLTKYFKEVDGNHDGKVTRQEYFDAMPLLHGAKNIDVKGAAQSM